MTCIRCQLAPIENRTTQLCASCSSDDRKAERHAIKDSLKKKPTPLARPTKPIKKRSDKRALQEEVYNKLVAVWKKDKVCAVRGCGGPCEDNHHMQGRDGDLLLDTSKWLPVCRTHHNQITTDSAWAIREGYSISRNAVDQTI